MASGAGGSSRRALIAVMNISESCVARGTLGHASISLSYPCCHDHGW
jgi:hypothetical protein